MKKCFLVLVLWLTAGAAFATDYAYELRQRELLAREAEVMTKVYDVDRPPLVPLDYRMNAQQRAVVTVLNDKIWQKYKNEIFAKTSRTSELELALDQAYNRYISAIEVHMRRIQAAENYELDEMNDPIIVDGLGQNGSKICTRLPGGILDCW